MMNDKIVSYLSIIGGVLLWISLILPYITIRIVEIGSISMPGLEFFFEYFLDFNISWILLFLGLLGGILAIIAGVLPLRGQKIDMPIEEIKKGLQMEEIDVNLPFSNLQNWMLIVLGGLLPLLTIIEWLLLEFQLNFGIIGLGFYLFIVGTGIILVSGFLAMQQDYLPQ